jgi:hypothetical protein
MSEHRKMQLPEMDEVGAEKDGIVQKLGKRLFMQLFVFTECQDIEAIKKAISSSNIDSVIYKDINDPQGIGILFMHENPDFFVTEVRELLSSYPFDSLVLRDEMTMLGRTYALGREHDLEEWLLKKPRRTVLNSDWTWCIWYPLRRKPSFELLTKEEQGKILYEHAMIGMTYGGGDFAHDVRLACHGLDANDNEFVIGLIGKDLHPLSRVVQDMRKTEQTAKYIQSLGPFFVGKVFWQSEFI